MDFVKIRGKDLQDCMIKMKMQYGPEAHIYDQRVITEGGMFGTGLMAKKIVEIDVGVPEKKSSKEKVERKLQDLKALLKNKSQSSGIQRRESLPEPVRTPRTYAPLPEKSESEEEELGLSIQEEIKKPLPVVTQTIADPSSLQIQRLKSRLLAQGMQDSYLNEVFEKVELMLSPLEKNRSHAVEEKTLEVLMERVQVDPDLFSGTGRNMRKILFFMGPTGSGKTTTIAKLAAKYHLHMGKSVSLYTTDNYRIGAIEQLKRYADVMGIPFFPVTDSKKFQECLARDSSELLLVDTAGYSHRNLEQIQRLQSYFEVFTEKDRVENILVISGTSAYNHMQAVMNAYEKLGYRKILLTKLDEAEFLGSAMELADKCNKVFTYFSVGQEVPFDIVSADKRLLSECVVYPEKIPEIKGEVFSRTV